MKFIVILFAYSKKQKSLRSILHFYCFAYIVNPEKQVWNSVEYFSLKKGSTGENLLPYSNLKAH